MNIYKYPLHVLDVQEVDMPRDATLLAVQVQNEQPCLWAVVDPDAPSETRIILTRGTGHPFDAPAVSRYIGTYQLQRGSFVGHVFEA